MTTTPDYSSTGWGDLAVHTSSRRSYAVAVGDGVPMILTTEAVAPSPPRRSPAGSRRPARSPAPGAVESTRHHPLVIARALSIAGGDFRRLRLNLDGSITVTNGPR